MRECKRCLMTDEMPGTIIEQDGVCNNCKLYDKMDKQYPVGTDGYLILCRIAEKIRKNRKGDYDVVVGVSGGCDSSLTLHWAVRLGLKPLAVHYDNTWNSEVASHNIEKMVNGLKVDYQTLIVDNREMDDIYRSFILSGTRDLEAATDLGLTTTLYRFASKYNIDYIFSGHSFRTEGIAPLGWSYMDGRYIKTIHKMYGRLPMRTFPNLPLYKFIYYAGIKKIKRIRPLYHIDYRKQETKRMLNDLYGWQWYDGHHFENWFTKFFIGYYRPKRFGIDTRYLEYSAMIRSGQLTKEGAREKLEVPLELDQDEEILRAVKKRLGFDDEEFNYYIYDNPRTTHNDFKNYKKTFHLLKPLFWLMYKRDVVPKSFYVKYCK